MPIIDLLYISEYSSIILTLFFLWALVQLKPKKAVGTALGSIAITALMGFFFSPVPHKIEKEFSNTVLRAKASNEKMVLTRTMLAIAQMDTDERLKARELFVLKHAFASDMNNTMRIQGGIFNMNAVVVKDIPVKKLFN